MELSYFTYPTVFCQCGVRNLSICSPLLFHLLPDSKCLPNSFSSMTILKNIFQLLIGISGKVMGIAPHTLIMLPSIHGFPPFTAVCPQVPKRKIPLIRRQKASLPCPILDFCPKLVRFSFFHKNKSKNAPNKAL